MTRLLVAVAAVLAVAAIAAMVLLGTHLNDPAAAATGPQTTPAATTNYPGFTCHPTRICWTGWQ